MHLEAYAFLTDYLEHEPVTDRDVVDIGSYDVNGCVRTLCGAARSFLGIDLRAGPGVDLVADGARLDLIIAPVDVIFCCEVLEHAPSAPDICAAAFRALRPGGRFIVTCATAPREPHGVMGGSLGDEFYRNVRPGELRTWLAVFDSHILAAQARGDLYAVARRVRR